MRLQGGMKKKFLLKKLFFTPPCKRIPTHKNGSKKIICTSHGGGHLRRARKVGCR